jgi:hypothetical protein
MFGLKANAHDETSPAKRVSSKDIITRYPGFAVPDQVIGNGLTIIVNSPKMGRKEVLLWKR